MTLQEDLGYIHQTLIQRKWTISTAESLTAGLIAATLASRSGSSAYLKSGLVVYTLEAKVRLLKVDEAMAAACNCVSDEVITQMLRGLQASEDTHLGIAVTGYAEPYGQETPHAYYGIYIEADREVQMVHQGCIRLEGVGRNEMRMHIVESVLDQLAQMLRTLDG